MNERFVAKFSWSRPATLQLAREIGVLTALVRVPLVPLMITCRISRRVT